MSNEITVLSCSQHQVVLANIKALNADHPIAIDALPLQFLFDSMHTPFKTTSHAASFIKMFSDCWQKCRALPSLTSMSNG
jgi:hypothetical protein